MDSNKAKELLKRQLQVEVRRFYRRDDRLWKQPIVEMLRDLQETQHHAVFFGGTLRSLLVSRIFAGKPGRPRDVDIVISGSTIEVLRNRFQEFVSRETRFGGLQLQRNHWQFDVWPLNKTWAFVNDSVENPVFSALPHTTFFNMEAIAVEIWPNPGKSREMFSGDDQFFDGILRRTLEINREENPYPRLCVVRAIIMAAGLDFSVGSRLARFISEHSAGMSADDIEEIQLKHYGQIRREGTTIKEWISFLIKEHMKASTDAIRLPIPRQLRIWPELVEPMSVRIHALLK